MARWPQAALLAAILTFPAARVGVACPGCQPTGMTVCEEIGTMDAAVIARLVKVIAPPAGAEDEIPKAAFQVTAVLKGGQSRRQV